MKKQLIVLILLCSIFFAGAGCSSTDASYSIYQSEFTSLNKNGEEYTVNYAQITGLDSPKQEDELNTILKESVVEWLNEDTDWVSKCKMYVTHKSSNYLSICYELEENMESAELEKSYIRFCVTVDIKNPKRLLLTDFVSANLLEAYIIDYKYSNESSPPIGSKEAQKIVSHASMSEYDYIREKLRQDSLTLEFTKSYMFSKQSFYLTDDGLVITRDGCKANDIIYEVKLS